MKNKHTPTPYKIYRDSTFTGSKDFPYLIMIDYCSRAMQPNVIASKVSHANAQFIVTACNCHEELVKVCEETFIELQNIYSILNKIASGETMKQWSRVEPRAVLGDIYGRLAIPFHNLKQALTHIKKIERR